MRGIFLSLVAVLIHEMGHIVFAKLMGVPLVSFSVNPIGAAMRFDFTGVGYGR
ncbi:MAG: M50 family metallopeptidase, partial [Clostridia bacterium]|nr:M50 family metallopeptidase [Clostridia bacterium]